jgi:hypothetical protein
MGDWDYPRLAIDGEENPCDGCHECGLRCTAGIQMTQPEFERIVAHLRAADARQVTRVLEQEKTIVWFEETTTEACSFYDVTRRGCIVYPVRPLICRLFGRVEWMPCPIGRPLRLIPQGLAIIQAYAAKRRLTFGEWCMELGIYDFGQLIGPAG